MNVQDMLRSLAQCRAAESAAKNEVAEAQAALEATPEWQALQKRADWLKYTKEKVADLSGMLRDHVLADFIATGLKPAYEEVTIKVFTTYRYDRDAAEAWCRVNAPTLLTLDVKGFEKTAKTLPGAPVEIVQEPRAQIASDLSVYLAEAVEA